MLGILANHARAARLRQRRAPDPARLDVPPGESPPSDAERQELFERLERALDELPEAFRPVLLLRVRHGLSAPEIAAALGRPAGAVRSQLARGLGQLRRLLPASLAGGQLLSLARPTRALACVREAVLGQATLTSTSIAGASALAGAIAVKKTLVLGLVAASALLVWRLWPGAGEPQQQENGYHLPERVAPLRSAETAAAGEEPAALPEPEGGAGRTAVGAPDPGAGERWSELVASLLARPGVLEVRATFEESGLAAAGELVLFLHPLLTGWQADEARVARTHEEGRVLFSDLPPGWAHVRLLRGGEQSVVIRAGERTTLELSVFDETTVAGEVVDAQGRPVAGAEIWLSECYRTNLGHIIAASDLAGRFQLESIGRDHYLCAWAPGYQACATTAARRWLAPSS
jgi:hypothetical protein